MTTLYQATKNGFQYSIEFNGKSTYFVTTEFGCEAYFPTLRRAKNFINKL